MPQLKPPNTSPRDVVSREVRKDLRKLRQQRQADERHGGRTTSPKILSRREKVREDLLGAGIELFAKNEFRDVSIDDICDAAQIARRTFYTYFQTKDEFLLAIAEPVFVEAIAYLEALDERPVDALADGLVDLYLYLWDKFGTALFVTQRLCPNHYEPMKESRDRFIYLMVQEVNRLHEQGRLLNDSVELTANLLINFSIEILDQCRDEDNSRDKFRTTLKGMIVTK